MAIKRTLGFGLFIAALLLAGVAVYLLLRPAPGTPPFQKITKTVYRTPSPYQIRIRLLRGASLPSVITLRIFNGALRQAFLDRAAGSKALGNLKKVEIKIPSDFWREKVAFFWVPPDKKKTDITSSVVLKRAPKGTLAFSPFSVYHADYQFKSSSRLPAKGTLYAEMRLEGRTLRSNRIILSPPADSEKTAFIQDANILYRLKEYDTLMKRAEARAATHPRDIPTHWFLGLALEKKGRYAEALEAYQIIRKNLPKSEKGTFREPPTLLWRHIQAIQEKLNPTQ